MHSTRRRIVCVDDNTDTCEMLRALLGQLGHDIVTYGSCAAALVAAGESSADLFILDTRLPDGSGFDLCRQLCGLVPHTPVIFYSGASTADERTQGFAMGARAYIVKPTVDELLNTVTSLLPDNHPA